MLNHGITFVNHHGGTIKHDLSKITVAESDKQTLLQSIIIAMLT